MRLTLSRIRPRRWAATIAATALSGYALDGVATVFGVALAASQILNGLDQTSLLGFLLVTYVFWFLGLRASLAANWSLLEATGTSTNAVSKFAYDLTGRRPPCRGPTLRVGRRLPDHGDPEGDPLLRRGIWCGDRQ